MNYKIHIDLDGLISHIAVALGALFIAFKLLGVIDWSWLWVLSPFWIYPVILIGIMVIVAIIIAIKG